MSYSLKPEDLGKINKLHEVWGTTEFLPPMDVIPKEFFCGNGEQRPEVEIANCLFYTLPLPDYEITINEGFEMEKISPFINAHLASREPKHEHKIAGVAFMISLMVSVVKEDSPNDN